MHSAIYVCDITQNIFKTVLMLPSESELAAYSPIRYLDNNYIMQFNETAPTCRCRNQICVRRIQIAEFWIRFFKYLFLYYRFRIRSMYCTWFPKNQIMVRKFLRFGSGSGRAQPGSNTPDNFCVDLLYILLERIGFSQSQGQSEFLF